MSNKTSPQVAEIRFYLFLSPIGIVMAFAFGGLGGFALGGFAIRLWVVFNAAKLMTNTFVETFDPEGAALIRDQGSDPFTNALGAQLNFDSDESRRI